MNKASARVNKTPKKSAFLEEIVSEPWNKKALQNSNEGKYIILEMICTKAEIKSLIRWVLR